VAVDAFPVTAASIALATEVAEATGLVAWVEAVQSSMLQRSCSGCEPGVVSAAHSGEVNLQNVIALSVLVTAVLLHEMAQDGSVQHF